ncbi:MAG: TorF family putative porin [Verrucomicrobiota bacterium]
MKRHLLKITFCALVLAQAGIARADQAADATAKAPEAAPAAAAAPEPAKEWSVAVGADYFSEYIFRGVDLLGNDPVFVPSVVGKWKGLTAYYYGYYGDSDSPNNTWYQEADIGADWTQTVLDGKLALTAGALYYLYPDGNSGADTWEIYGKVTYVSYFNPYIALNWDIDEFNAGYGVVGVTHTYDISKYVKLEDGKLTITGMAQLGIDFGYNSRATQSNVNWNDILFGPSITFAITPALNVHAGWQTSIALNSLNDIGQHNNSFANIGVGYAF